MDNLDNNGNALYTVSGKPVTESEFRQSMKLAKEDIENGVTGILPASQEEKLRKAGIDPFEYVKIKQEYYYRSLNGKEKFDYLYNTAVEMQPAIDREQNTVIEDALIGIQRGVVSIGEGLAELPFAGMQIAQVGIKKTLDYLGGQGTYDAVKDATLKGGDPISGVLFADYSVPREKISSFFDEYKLQGSKAAQMPIEIKSDNGWFYGANPNNIAYQIGNGLGSMLGFIGSGKFVSALSPSMSKKSANLLGGYIYTNNAIYDEMSNYEGIDKNDAAALSALISIPITLTENYAIDKLGKIFSEPAKRSALKGAIEDAVKEFGEKGITKGMYNKFSEVTVKGFTNRMSNTLLKMGEGALVEGTEEFVQQGIQIAGQQLYDKFSESPVFKSNLFSKDALNDMINNGFWGGVIGGMLGFGGGVYNNKVYTQSVFNYVGENVKKNNVSNINRIKDVINYKVKSGALTQEEGEKGIKMVDDMVRINQEEMPRTLTDMGARYQAFDFINQRNVLQAQLDDINSKPIDPLLAQADDDVRGYLSGMVNIYNQAIDTIGKTKGQVSEAEIQKQIVQLENSFRRREEAAQGVAQAEEGVAEAVATGAKGIEMPAVEPLELGAKMSRDEYDARMADIEAMRAQELEQFKDSLNEPIAAGSEQTIGQRIEDKYNQEIQKLNAQYEKEKDVEPLSEGVQGLRAEEERGKESPELRAEEEKVIKAQADLIEFENILERNQNNINDLRTKKLRKGETQEKRDMAIANLEEQNRILQEKIGGLREQVSATPSTAPSARAVFQQIQILRDNITAKGGKRKEKKEKFSKFVESQDEGIRQISDNFKEIVSQLESKGLLTKSSPEC